jgi:hypothetical protein
VIIQVGSNTLDCDVAATFAAFQGYTPHWCDCNGCRNFRVAQDAIFTEPVLEFFSQFGIDPAKPAEIYALGPPPDEDSLLTYGGWFHFVGEAISVDDVIDCSNSLEVYFSRRPALVPQSFSGQPLVQLEFEWKVPWLLPEPWPSDK